MPGSLSRLWIYFAYFNEALIVRVIKIASLSEYCSKCLIFYIRLKRKPKRQNLIMQFDSSSVILCLRKGKGCILTNQDPVSCYKSCWLLSPGHSSWFLLTSHRKNFSYKAGKAGKVNITPEHVMLTTFSWMGPLKPQQVNKA